MNIVLIGGKKLVYFLSRTLVSKGHRVTIINENHDECVWLTRQLNLTVIHGDASNPRILEEAGVELADEVLAMTPRDEDNLVICQLARNHFKVNRTLAIVNDPDLEEVFKGFGITAVSTINILATIIEQRARFDDITNVIPFEEGKANLTEIVLHAGSPVVGKPLMSLDLPTDALIAMIIRNGEPIIPRGQTVLLPEDRLAVMTLPGTHGLMIRTLTGEAD